LVARSARTGAGTARYASVQFEGDALLVRRIVELVGFGGTGTRSDGRARWTVSGTQAKEFLRAIQPYVYGSARSERITEVLRTAR
jgi:hypothetical protein